MIGLLLFVLSEAFSFYYNHLCRQALQLTNDGLNEITRPRWTRIKATTAWMKPCIGFIDFVKVLSVFMMMNVFFLMITNKPFPFWVWVIAGIFGLLNAYRELIDPFYRWVNQHFKGDEPNDRPRWWLLQMRWSHVTQGLKYDYPYTFAFFILAKRLFICNLFGHKWSTFEHVKYGDFGQSRTCKRCKISHNQDRGVNRYSETHGSAWKRIKNPDAVFFRKYEEHK